MRVAFTKMHGLGNDFAILRGEAALLPDPERIRVLADRHRGIGFDQLLWVEPARHPGEDLHYRVFNTDGSEAEQCGNGARCIARLAAPAGGDLRLGHAGGITHARVAADGQVTVQMAVPEFTPARVPFIADRTQDSYRLEAGDQHVEVGVVSMGNPHAVLQVGSVTRAPVATLGPLLEHHGRFPSRANIGFMQVVARDRIRLRVFERGVGETQACGTGACAAVAVGRQQGLLDTDVAVELPGGVLTIHWAGPGSPVTMTGEAVFVFEGTVQL